MKKKREYALYKGDKFIDIGTLDYLANLINVKKKTIYFISTPSYHERLEKRKSNNAYIAVKLEDENELEKGE